jgi:hypothetical protein
MARTQITLDPEDHRRARARAASLGISLAAYVRTLVARDIASPRLAADPSSVFDLGNTRRSDVAARKSDYVAEAIEGRIVKRRRRAPAR